MQKDDNLQRKLDKEIEKRQMLEEQLKVCLEEQAKMQSTSIIGPDLEEGPHSTIREDEFFDAVETGLDKIEEDLQIRVALKLQTQQVISLSFIVVQPKIISIHFLVTN